MANTQNANDKKLGPNWEGPYKVVSLVGAGSYRLEDMDGNLSLLGEWISILSKKYCSDGTYHF